MQISEFVKKYSGFKFALSLYLVIVLKMQTKKEDYCIVKQDKTLRCFVSCYYFLNQKLVLKFYLILVYVSF